MVITDTLNKKFQRANLKYSFNIRKLLDIYIQGLYTSKINYIIPDAGMLISKKLV